MSSGRRKSDDGGRSITADEAELWQYATRALTRVKAKPRVVSADRPAEHLSSAAVAPPRMPVMHPKGKPDREPPARPDARTVPAPRQAPPPLAEFERRKARQIASGKKEVEARIDLHGLRQRDAHARLRAFLADAYARGLKTVLVITGKGGEQPADRLGELAGERQRGVLRRSVPHWLAEPELRAIVLSVTQAGVRHGGAGALYVQLRKGARSG